MTERSDEPMPTISCPSSGSCVLTSPFALTSPLAGCVRVLRSVLVRGAAGNETVASGLGVVLSPVFGNWTVEVDNVFARLGTSTFSWCGRRGEHEATVMVAGGARYSPGKVMNVACPHQH